MKVSVTEYLVIDREYSWEDMVATLRRQDLFGFMTPCVESKFPWTYGLFGGYGAPTYPLGKVKGINAFDSLVELPEEKLEGAAPPKCVLYGAIPAEISPEAIVEAGRALRGWFGSSRG